MNAKNAPLTPSFPNRRPTLLFFRPKTRKRALTKPTLSYTALLFYAPWVGESRLTTDTFPGRRSEDRETRLSLFGQRPV